MKKTYISPSIETASVEPFTLMAASTGTDSQINNGEKSDMDADNGQDETDAKGMTFSLFDD